MATNWATWAQLYYDGAYNVLPNFVDAATAVTLERGVSDELDLKPAVCSFRLNDPSDLYRPSNAASPLYGQTGPYMRGAFATGGSVRFTGETQKMVPGQTDDHQEAGGVTTRGNRWVDVRMSGPLGRVGQWRDPLAAPLFEQISSAYASTSRGYWPMQDGTDSTLIANVATRGPAGTFGAGVRFAAADGPAGSDKVLELTSTSSLTFRYLSMSTSAGYQLAVAMETPGVDGTLREVWRWRTTNGYTYVWSASTTNYSLNVFDRDGTNVSSNTFSSGSDAAAGNQWIYFRFKVTQSGGNVQVEPSWYAELAENFWGVTVTFAGSIGAPTTGGVVANAATAGAHYGHHFAVTGVSDNLESSDFTDAFAGYRRESAADRFTRLCGSRGLPYVIRGTAADTVEMGVQPLATFQDQLKEIRQTERGLIFDRGDNIGIVFATFGYLAAQAAAPVLELTWPTNIAPPLEETTDARDTFNLITVKNRNGSSAVAELTTGRQGTQDPPTGAGRLDKTVDVNLASDGPLADLASWWMRFYTQDGPRFDTVTVDVDAHPELLTACHAAEPGTFMRITGRTPDPLLLLILSTAQKTHRKRNVFTFKVAAGDLFRLAVEDGDGRQDVSSSTLEDDYGPTDTWLAVINAKPYDEWSRTSTPYDVVVAGERITIVGVSEPNSVAEADGTFEDGYGYGWYTVGGSAAATNLRAHRGATSVECTVSGSPSQWILRHDNDAVPVPAAPGQQYRVTCWVYTSSTKNVTVTLDYLDSGGAWMSASSTTTSVTAGSWRQLSVTGTCPANTAYLEFGPTLGGSPANGTYLWVDDIDCQRVDAYTGRQLLLAHRAQNGVSKDQSAGAEVHIFEPVHVG